MFHSAISAAGSPNRLPNSAPRFFPGFAATEILYDGEGRVKGVATGDMGVAADGERKPTFEPGFEFHAKFTILAEGCRGHLGKEVIARFELDRNADPQHYGIGLKEIWEVVARRSTRKASWFTARDGR